jgi:hypothetical protein
MLFQHNYIVDIHRYAFRKLGERHTVTKFTKFATKLPPTF